MEEKKLLNLTSFKKFSLFLFYSFTFSIDSVLNFKAKLHNCLKDIISEKLIYKFHSCCL